MECKEFHKSFDVLSPFFEVLARTVTHLQCTYVCTYVRTFICMHGMLAIIVFQLLPESRNQVHLGLHCSSYSNHSHQHWVYNYGCCNHLETQQEEVGHNGQETSQEVVESIGLSCDSNGVNVDIWSADSGSRGDAPLGLHLHHHGGLPRCVDLLHLHCLPQGCSRCLLPAVEDKGRNIRQKKQHCLFHRNGRWPIIARDLISIIPTN